MNATALAVADKGFYRSATRVAILSVVAPAAYELWWLWQFVKFTRREGFPRARAFWWYLVPIYGWIVLNRQLDELKTRYGQVTGTTFNASLAIGLFIASEVASRFITRTSSATNDLAVTIVGGLLLGGSAYMIQGAANAIQAQQFGEEGLRGMSVGEVIATLVGLVLLAFDILAALPS